MINIIVKKETNQNNNEVVIKRILIKGHADYAEYGKDIVCSSVSSMVILAINIIGEIDKNAIKYTQKDSYTQSHEPNTSLIEIVNLMNNEGANKVLKTLVNMLKQLANDYPENIRIRNEEN